MVDALHQAHAALRPHAQLIDVRPDGSRLPRLLRNGRVVGNLLHALEAREDDAAADRAVERVIADGLYRRVGAGHIWYRYRFHDLPALDDYVRDSGRMMGYSAGTRGRLARGAAGPIIVRRALAYQFLARA